MRKVKRIIHKQFGSIGNFFAIAILVAFTVIFINTYVLSKRYPSHDFTEHATHMDDLLYKQNETVKSFGSEALSKRISKQLTPDIGCEIEETCSDHSIPYKVLSGEGTEKYPRICFNNKLLIHENMKDGKIGRGVNFVAIDGQTFVVKLVQIFDTYLEENLFLRTIKLNLSDSDIIIMASFDEMTYALREASLSLLEKYGSQLIRNVKYRDSFVMIGQKGLAKGKAIEMHKSKGNRDFGSIAHISGCANFPLGQITKIEFPRMEVNKDGKISVGTLVENCGLLHSCRENEFPVHVYTGKDNNDEPKICVNGKYIIAKGINDAGRGLNIVIVSNYKDIVQTGHFDTWKEDSTNLEIFLENLQENFIIIVVTFDEASSKLSQHSKNLFFDLGSATIQNLKYRDVWMLIGQKGIKGFSPYEEISYATTANTYPPPIDKRFCVPQILNGTKIRPDPLPSENKKRREFCTRYNGYDDFCSDANIDKNLVSVPLINKTLDDNPIYSTPILIIAGISHNSLRMCLETILMQPGINIENVIVAVDENFAEALELISLFNFHGEKIFSSSTYMEHYEKALKRIWELFPNKDKVIVIEEELILSPDFLYTLALLSDIFRRDETIGAIQMWNPNSYDIINGSIEFIYRVDQFFGLGYLLKRTFYENNMKNSFKACCSNRAWNKWTFSNPLTYLMPDVSRVFRRPINGDPDTTKYLENLFNQKRKTNLNPFPPLANIETLRKDKYTKELIRSIESATLLTSIKNCETIDFQLYDFLNSQNSSSAFTYLYQQESLNDTTNLSPILPCFGMFSYKSVGLYNGLLRFHSNRFQFYFIGSKSPFYNRIATIQ